MPRAANISAVRGESVTIPGIYEAWIRTNAAWRLLPDERWLEDLDDAEHGALMADARAAAEVEAAERIEAGEPLRAKWIRAGRMLHPWIRDFYSAPDLPMFRQRKLFDITRDDVVTYNAESTVRWQRDQDAARAQREHAAQRQTSGYNGRNGAELIEVVE